MRKNISKESATAFLNLSTNVFLILCTFWLGLVIQTAINRNNMTARERAEMLNVINPIIDSLNVKYGPLLNDLYFIWDKKNDKEGKPVISKEESDKITTYLLQNKHNIANYYWELSASIKGMQFIDMSKDSLEIVGAALPFFAVCIEHLNNDSTNKNQPLDKDSIKLWCHNLLNDPTYIEIYGTGPGIVDTMRSFIQKLDNSLLITLLSESMPIAIDAHNKIQEKRDEMWGIDKKNEKTTEENFIRWIGDNPFQSILVILVIFVLIVIILFIIIHRASQDPTQSKMADELGHIAGGVEKVFAAQEEMNKLISIEEELAILASPFYHEQLKKETAYINKLFEVIFNADLETSMPRKPIIDDDDSLITYKELFIAEKNYRKQLVGFLKQNNIPLPRIEDDNTDIDE